MRKSLSSEFLPPGKISYSSCRVDFPPSRMLKGPLHLGGRFSILGSSLFPRFWLEKERYFFNIYASEKRDFLLFVIGFLSFSLQ